MLSSSLSFSLVSLVAGFLCRAQGTPLLGSLSSSPRHAIRQVSPGLTIQSSCSANTTSNIETALLGVFALTGAALDAINYPLQVPYSTFFPIDDVSTVQQILQTIHNVASGSGPSVAVRCDDPAGLCAPAGALPGTGDLAYATKAGAGISSDYIVICPAYRYPTTPNSCASNALSTTSMADTLLHEMTHLRAITGSQLQVVDLGYGLNGSMALNNGDNSSNPTRNADSYAFLARWSWLGLWGDGRPNTPCRSQYRYMDKQADLISLPIAGQSVNVPEAYQNGNFDKREILRGPSNRDVLFRKRPY
jgi:hypothetical protein